MRHDSAPRAADLGSALPGNVRFARPVWGVVFEREMEEQKARWPRRTTPLQVRLIAEYVLSLQQ